MKKFPEKIFPEKKFLSGQKKMFANIPFMEWCPAIGGVPVPGVPAPGTPVFCRYLLRSAWGTGSPPRMLPYTASDFQTGKRVYQRTVFPHFPELLPLLTGAGGKSGATEPCTGPDPHPPFVGGRISPGREIHRRYRRRYCPGPTTKIVRFRTPPIPVTGI